MTPNETRYQELLSQGPTYEITLSNGYTHRVRAYGLAVEYVTMLQEQGHATIERILFNGEPITCDELLDPFARC